MPSDLPAGYRWANPSEMDRPDAIVVKRTADENGVPYTQDEADLAVPDTVEFGLTMHVTVEVPASLVPADWAESGAPKRIYNWPEALTQALHAAMVAQLAEDGPPEFDEAQWIDNDGYHDPSTY